MFYFQYFTRFFFILLSLNCWSQELNLLPKKQYSLNHEPLDVVIPCADKDIETLEFCIQGIKKNLGARRIIVVSPYPLTHQAEWFDEKQYPFTPIEIAQYIFN